MDIRSSSILQTLFDYIQLILMMTYYGVGPRIVEKYFWSSFPVNFCQVIKQIGRKGLVYSSYWPSMGISSCIEYILLRNFPGVVSR